MDLIVENIRCFVNRQTIPIKPLTLLTGENSSGKSTLLAALAAVHDPLGFPLRPRFNDPPYNLGNFDTIATYKGGRAGQEKSFSLGYVRDDKAIGEQIELVATYANRQGLVEVTQVVLKNAALTMTFSFLRQDKVSTIKMIINRDDGTQTYEYDMSMMGGVTIGLGLNHLLYLPLSDLGTVFQQNSGNDKQPTQQERDALLNLVYRLSLAKALSVAPIRTRPKRTYDQITEEFTPEGEHIPFVLSGLLDDPPTREILERFGAESGLFRRINIKKLGDKISDPIQVMVTSSNRPANLLDVGYGVSQALPVVVESLLAAPESLLLLQQPEVHLHPRAQAALGSLLVDLLATSQKQFVVETHSDYIIDRVRREVASGKIAAHDVSILYCERQAGETIVYALGLDDNGNILDAPPSYREFFLHEEFALLSRGRAVGKKG